MRINHRSFKRDWYDHKVMAIYLISALCFHPRTQHKEKVFAYYLTSTYVHRYHATHSHFLIEKKYALNICQVHHQAHA